MPEGGTAASTDRRLAALLALRALGAARTSDLALLLKLPSRTSANKWLKRLVDAGLTRSHALGLGEELAFTLTRQGWRALTEGRDPPSAGWIDVDPTPHRLLVARVWVLLAAALHDVVGTALTAWPEEILRRQPGRTVVPDLLLDVARPDGSRHRLWLEADAGSERVAFIKDKLARFAAQYPPKAGPPITMVWVTADEARAAQLLRLVAESIPHVPTRLASVDALRVDTILRPIWRSPQQDGPVPLINELSSAIAPTTRTPVQSTPSAPTTTTPAAPAQMTPCPSDGDQPTSPKTSPPPVRPLGHPPPDTMPLSGEPAWPPRPASRAPARARDDQGRPHPDSATWLTIPQAAADLQVSERLLRRLYSEGQLDAAVVRVGRTVRVHRTNLVRVLADAKEHHHGMVAEEEAPELGNRRDRDLLVDLQPRPDRQGQGPEPGDRLLLGGRRQAGAEDLRGQGGRRRDADAYRRWLLAGAKGDPDAP